MLYVDQSKNKSMYCILCVCLFITQSLNYKP